MAWTWREVKTSEDAAEFLDVLKTNQRRSYPNTTVGVIDWYLRRPERGMQYWIGSNGAERVCYAIHFPPGRRHEPSAPMVGAKTRGDWLAAITRAARLCDAHVKSRMPAMARQYGVSITHYRPAPIRVDETAVLADAVAALEGAALESEHENVVAGERERRRQYRVRV